MVSVGITGTRKGMNKGQMALLMDILLVEDFTEYHHGDCVGVDKQFHEFITEKIRKCEYKDSIDVVIHPPLDKKYRAFCKECTTIYEEKPYLERNKDLVDACSLLIAIPDKDGIINKVRSGTWSTIRYAKKMGKDIVIII